MIITITINPAVDKSTTVEKLIPGKKLRCTVGLSAVLVFIECPARNRSRFEKTEVEVNNKKLNSNSSAG